MTHVLRLFSATAYKTREVYKMNLQVNAENKMQLNVSSPQCRAEA
jgi:hypothetical protein